MTAKRSSNTTGNNKKGKVPPQLEGKGFDAHPERINRKGRPKDFDQLRKLFQDIASEEITIQGKKYTRAQAIGIAMSMDKKHMREFLEFAFGKVPQAVDVTSGGEKLGFEKDDTRNEILRKLDSIATATGAGAVSKPTNGK